MKPNGILFCQWIWLLLIICYQITQFVGFVYPADNGTDNIRNGNDRQTTDNVDFVYEATRLSCYSEEGKAKQCMPLFTNVAEGAPVVATSTCRSGEEICLHASNRQEQHCRQCDPMGENSPSVLTDRHQMNNQTHWISGGILPGETVNLTISLNKRFDVYYISIQPYGHLPDSLALYKSADFGKSWTPWQYFSTDCYRAYKLPTSNVHNTHISPANIQEVLCVSLPVHDVHDQSLGRPTVIAFSTTIGRPSSQPWSQALIDWMTMTDLQVSMSRFHKGHVMETSQHDTSGLLMTPGLLRLSSKNVFRVGELEHNHMGATSVFGTLGMSRGASRLPENKTANTSPLHFALSEIAIGGRCKCNGHASRCIRERPVNSKLGAKKEWGSLRCDCQHNTAGDDCEHCAAGYLDGPWARATLESVNECKRCECNLHSNQCVFSQQIYLMSQMTSGGVCQHCQHNTVGRRCHHCNDGYYRDWTKPVSHYHACLECRCHPIGSLPNKPCDRRTGQCPCKPGVAGQACNRCQEGYKQTRLSDHPCIRAIEHYAYRRREVDTSDCQHCKPDKKRIRFKTFCKHEAVFRGIVVSSKVDDDRVRYEVQLQDTWRVDGTASRLLPRKTSPNLPAYPIWIRTERQTTTDSSGRQTTCKCPNLKLGDSYLFFTQSYQVPYANRMELMLETKSIVLPWRESWRRRLNKFGRRSTRGRCAKFYDAGTGVTTDARILQVHRLHTAPGYHPIPKAAQKQGASRSSTTGIRSSLHVGRGQYPYSPGLGRLMIARQQMGSSLKKSPYTSYNTHSGVQRSPWGG